MPFTYVGDLPEVTMPDQPVLAFTPGYAGSTNVIADQLATSGTMLELCKNQIIDATDGLNAVLVDVQKPSTWDTVLSGVVIEDIASIEVNSVPEPSVATLPGFSEVLFPTIGTLREAPDVSVDYVDPTDPGNFTTTLSHTVSDYVSNIFQSVFDRIKDGVDNGGTGLTPAVQAARAALDSERKAAANEKAYLAAQVSVNSRALSCPDFVFAALESQMAAEIARQEQASSNEIYIADGDLAQKNSQFMIEKGIDLERINRAFWEVSEKFGFQVKQVIAEFDLKAFSETVQAYLGKWQAIAIAMKAKVDAANVIVAVNQPIIEKAKVEASLHVSQIDAISKERSSIVDTAKTEAEIYKTKIEGITAWYNAQSENDKNKIAKAALELNKAEAELKFLNDNQMSSRSIQTEILGTLAKVFAQFGSAALNTVQTSVGHQTGAHSQISQSFNNSLGKSMQISDGRHASESRNISQKGPEVSG